MKMLIISIIALLLVFGLVIGNYFLINNIYEHMVDEVITLNVYSYTEIEALSRYWNQKRVIVSLSVPHRISDELEKNLVLVNAKIKYGSYVEFEEARSSLLNSIEEMKIHAGISLDTIL